MSAYRYIALSPDGKELSGIIEGPDETGARNKLNGLGLSVVSLEVTISVSSTPEHPGKTTFEFSGFDKNKKKVVGTIAADGPQEAYARLFNEYKIDATSLAIKGRALDLTEIQKQYQSSSGTKDGHETSILKENAERKELLEKIDFTMTRIQEFLHSFKDDLKQDERDTIQAYVNQLIRIRDSTNLGHIRATCEKMLDHIQKQELFIHEEQKTKESAHIKVETREMLSSLKRTGLTQDISFSGILAKIRQYRVLGPVAEMLLKFMPEPSPEIRQARDEVKNANRHIMQYIRILIMGNATVRSEAWQTIQTLRAEKKRLKLKIHGLIQEEEARAQESQSPGRKEEFIKDGFGWILGIYLFLYMVSYPLTVKQIPFSFPGNLYFYSTTLPKYLLMFCFLFYAAAQLKYLFFSHAKWSRIVLYPGTFFIYLLILINLL